MTLTELNSLFDLSTLIATDIDEYKNQLYFRETLIISKFEKQSELPYPVGGICIDVQAALDNKFVVYVASKFNLDDSTGGSKITTWVDSSFYTLEEKRVEFVYGKDPEKQSLYIGSEKDSYLVSHKLNDTEQTKRRYSSNITKSLVSEGANFLIMRLMAINMYVGCFETSAVYINGDLCRNIYECSGAFPATINNIDTEGVKIDRIIIEECGIIHRCSTILTNCGHIVKQEWEKCVYVMQLNPLQDPIAFAISGAACGCGNTISLINGWKEDMELMSDYLDHLKVSECKAKDYLDDTPELTSILEDYVKTLLLQKPNDVLDFTTDYFMRYSKRT